MAVTSDQINTIAAVKGQLELAAIRFSAFHTDPDATPNALRDAEQNLIACARAFVDTVNAIEVTQWGASHPLINTRPQL